jgi:hypothetical protein
MRAQISWKIHPEIVPGLDPMTVATDGQPFTKRTHRVLRLPHCAMKIGNTEGDKQKYNQA